MPTARTIGPEATVGPFAYLRPGARLGRGAKVGTFVEVKGADIGAGSKVPHLSYVGNATIGVGVNIGAGTIFANYDGVGKSDSVVGDHARTGADNVFVAPIEIGAGAYTGAGTVIFEDVPPGALAVSGGAKQRTIENWTGRKRPGTAAAAAAAAAAADDTATTRQQHAADQADHPEDDPSAAQPSGAVIMSSLQSQTHKNLMLLSGRGYPELAEEIASELGITRTPTSAYDFANGEVYVRYEESVRGCDAFVVQSMTDPDQPVAGRVAGHGRRPQARHAKRITVVLPFYPYARQDKKQRGREPISARLVADMYKTAGADRILTVDLHTAQIQGFFDGPVDHLFALPLLADYVAERYAAADLTSSPRTPAGSGWPSGGPTGSAAARWRSSTRPATRWCRTRSPSTGSSARSRAAPA